jgi:hypothetical protein
LHVDVNDAESRQIQAYPIVAIGGLSLSVSAKDALPWSSDDPEARIATFFVVFDE